MATTGAHMLNLKDYLLHLFPGDSYNQLTLKSNKGVVSKETVVLRRWGSNIQQFWYYQQS